jgi:hypothetical protein
MLAVVGAGVRQLLARSPWVRWVVVAALAVSAGLAMAHAGRRVDAARAAWGDTRAVLVADTDISPGTPLEGVTHVVDLPGPLLPVSALDRVEPGATARQAIAVGEVLVQRDVAAVAAPQALIPDGWLAVPVSEAVPSGALPGDRVVVASGGVVLAADGLIVAAEATGVLVAVPAAAAAQVAQAAANGDAVLLLQP